MSFRERAYMEDHGLFLCSHLMKVSGGRTERIGTLEEIYSDGCAIRIEVPLPIGTQISIRCIECPNGDQSCIDCKFNGRVQSQESDPLLGCLVQVEFAGRIWSAEQWRPEHLTKIGPMAYSADA
jgi:hypothetical protein